MIYDSPVLGLWTARWEWAGQCLALAGALTLIWTMTVLDLWVTDESIPVSKTRDKVPTTSIVDDFMGEAPSSWIYFC